MARNVVERTTTARMAEISDHEIATRAVERTANLGARASKTDEEARTAARTMAEGVARAPRAPLSDGYEFWPCHFQLGAPLAKAMRFDKNLHNATN